MGISDYTQTGLTVKDAIQVLLVDDLTELFVTQDEVTDARKGEINLKAKIDEIDNAIDALEASGLVTLDTHTGDGVTLTYGVTVEPTNKNSLFINIGGVLQNPASYEVSGQIVTFYEAPYDGAAITIRNVGRLTTSAVSASSVNYIQDGGNSRTVQNRLRITRYLSDYDGITDALNAIGPVTPTRLVIDTAMPLTADTTVTANVALKWLPNALASGAYALSILGDYEAGNYQTFGSDVTITGLKHTKPEWWGNNETPGTTDMSSEIQSAINALDSGGIVELGSTIYACSGLTIQNGLVGIELRGKSRVGLDGVGTTGIVGATTLLGNSASNILSITGTGLEGATNAIGIRNILFDANDVSAVGIDVNKVYRGVTIQNCGFQKFTTTNSIGISFDDAWAHQVIDCTFFDFKTGIFIGEASDDIKIIRPYMRAQAISGETITHILIDSTTGDSADNITIEDGDLAGLYGVNDRFVSANGCRLLHVEKCYQENTNVASDYLVELIDCDILNMTGSYYNVTSTFDTDLIGVTSGGSINFVGNRVANMKATNYIISGCSNLSFGRSTLFGNNLGTHTSNVVDDTSRFGYYLENFYPYINGTHFFDGAYYYGGRILSSAKTSDYTVTNADSMRTFTNKGATGAVNFNLPTASTGLNYKFVKYANLDVTITCSAGDSINGGASGGNISNTASETMKVCEVQAVDGTEWIVLFEGSWVNGP